jgi:hypothetical protein
MANPTIEELRNSDHYELVDQVEHHRIKEFVIKQLTTDGKLIRWYMYYQVIMILTGLFFVTRPVVLALRGYSEPLIYLFIAIAFTFSLLIVIHELLHALALKITGAPHISIGGYLRKFIFYAEADGHVLNRKQFALVALTPLFVVKAFTLAGIVLNVGEPAFYFWIFVMSAHSLFCAGDIGMLSYFHRFPDSEIYTFDVKKEKRSYFYKRK